MLGEPQTDVYKVCIGAGRGTFVSRLPVALRERQVSNWGN